MHNHLDTSTISCKTHQDSFTAMNVLKQYINSGSSVGEKAKYAEELMVEAASLLKCTMYEDQNLDCNICRMIAGLHHKTAELILKAKCLSQ